MYGIAELYMGSSISLLPSSPDTALGAGGKHPDWNGMRYAISLICTSGLLAVHQVIEHEYPIAQEDESCLALLSLCTTAPRRAAKSWDLLKRTMPTTRL
jgi:hypothetical protein